MDPSGRHAAILRHLSGARWYAGKGREVELRSLTELPNLAPIRDGRPLIRSVIAEVTGPGGGASELYHLLVSYHPTPDPQLGAGSSSPPPKPAAGEIGRWTDPELGPVVAYDATADPVACRELLSALSVGWRNRAAGNTVSWHQATSSVPVVDDEPRVFGGQQSNTTILFGGTALVKVFRRLELGRNLDIEVHAALSGIPGVVSLFGWLEGSWQTANGPMTADLAMATGQLSDTADGWELACARLAAGESFGAEAAQLGRALAGIHQALRERFPTAAADGEAIAAGMRERFAEALDVAPELTNSAAALESCFDGLADQHLDLQRLHGDFHLGQTLRSPRGWSVIDFEGEPTKPADERRRPDSVWRDVAGMLRSFDYATHGVPDEQGTRWYAECRDAFLDAYTSGAGLTAEQALALRAYEADKAIYEVVYETRYRPDWVAIPLRAIAALPDLTTNLPDDRH